jgi:competence protein ComEC
MRKSTLVLLVTIGLLACVSVFVWSAVFRAAGGLLTVTFLDVGQGDSIFVEAPSGRQALIDGGLGRKVLRELSKTMPWYDRTLDVVIATHPDADHIGGLVDVLSRYDVSYIVHSSVAGDTATAEALVDSIRQEGAEEIVALRGQVVELGGGAYIEVLFPDRPVPRVDTNTGCVVARLVYGATSFMLSCDAPDEVENYLVWLDGPDLRANILKVGHHGSKNSSSSLFLGFVAPEYGVFSRGCNNTYGHPAPETVGRFKEFGIPTLDTCTEGAITLVSDGERVWRK